jgi:hypothetical protein
MPLLKTPPPTPEQLVQDKTAVEAIGILERQIERYELKAADIACQDHPDQERVRHVRDHLRALELELTIQRRRLVEMN